AFVYAAKSLFRRGRPNGPGRAWRADRYAFPSGHAARAAAVALALTRERPSLTPPALLWAAAVALARVVLGRHYLTDVAGGLASGLLFAALLRRMTPRTISVGRNAKPAKKRQETPR
ncbi:MAG: phosphatase PAP2 family protein, partial [Anaerolineales bacterium]|nr:phosphatase PAP2 family protein [Anaerolineales bacterium]